MEQEPSDLSPRDSRREELNQLACSCSRSKLSALSRKCGGQNAASIQNGEHVENKSLCGCGASTNAPHE